MWVNGFNLKGVNIIPIPLTIHQFYDLSVTCLPTMGKTVILTVLVVSIPDTPL